MVAHNKSFHWLVIRFGNDVVIVDITCVSTSERDMVIKQVDSFFHIEPPHFLLYLKKMTKLSIIVTSKSTVDTSATAFDVSMSADQSSILTK